jgi:hypothetical protein
VLNLLEVGAHDIIVAYQQQYDDVMHKTTPESIDALHALSQDLLPSARVKRADGWGKPLTVYLEFSNSRTQSGVLPLRAIETIQLLHHPI